MTMTMTYLDHGHYVISGTDAHALSGGELPRPGWEVLVAHEGRHYWLKQSTDQGRAVWTIRLAQSGAGSY